MYVHRTSSLLIVSAAILTAGLLVAESLETPPSRFFSVQAASQKSGPIRASRPQPPSGFPTPLAEQRMAGGYWRLDHTFQPVLIITNILQNVALPITPILYAADGTEYQLPVVTLAPAGVYSIDIRAALGAAPVEIKGHFSEYGSAALKYVWHGSGAASALVENRDAKRSLNFGFELRTPMGATAPKAMKHGESATVQEGLWWREDPGVNGFITLVDIAPRPVNVQVQVLSDYGAFETERTIHLQPNETRTLDLFADASGSSGGIRVEGAEKDVMVAGGLENPQEGYSAQIPFVTTSPETKPTSISVSSVGLMLGAPDPMMKFPSGTQFGVYLALRNATSKPILVNPTLYYMQGSGVTKTPLNTLALAARQSKLWTPEELSKELGLPKFSGMINLVFSYQGSPSDVIMANGSIDQTKTYVFEIKMEGVGKSLGKGLKDWDVSNGNDTMISLLNLDQKDRNFWVTLFFDGGHYKLPVQLNAGGSAMFNVSDIIMMQEPDSDGHKIPPGTLHGTAVLSAASADPEWINVGVSVGIFNVSTATCVGRCPNCANYTSFQVLPYNSSTSFAPVGGTATFVAWAFLQSDQLWHIVTSLSSWSSDNGNVATSQGSGSFTGVSPGSFDAYASVDLPYGNADCIGSTACPTQNWVESAFGLIQKPTSLRFISVSVLPDGTFGAVGCPGSAFSGIMVDIKYQVLDQQTPPQPIPASNMTPHEQGTHFDGSPLNSNIGPKSGYPTSSATTAADGTFHDVPFGACANTTFSSLSATQNITMILGTTSYAVRSQNWTVTGTTAGHGTIQNGIDVSASR